MHVDNWKKKKKKIGTYPFGSYINLGQWKPNKTQCKSCCFSCKQCVPFSLPSIHATPQSITIFIFHLPSKSQFPNSPIRTPTAEIPFIDFPFTLPRSLSGTHFPFSDQVSIFTLPPHSKSEIIRGFRFSMLEIKCSFWGLNFCKMWYDEENLNFST